MALRSILPAVFLSFVFLWSACGDETEKNQAAVIGYWKIHKALRNQKETGTLSDVWFHFGNDGKMETNLPIGMEGPTDYDVEKNTIHQKGDQPVSYQIKNVADSSLTLLLEMRGLEFEFQLTRTDGPVEPPLSPEEPAPSDSVEVQE